MPNSCHFTEAEPVNDRGLRVEGQQPRSIHVSLRLVGHLLGK